MIIPCPVCGHKVAPETRPRCVKCGAEVAVLGTIMTAAADSVRLGLESLREGRDREALDYAYEGWGLMQTRETAGIGLVAALKNRDSTEVTRWLRRRRRMDADASEDTDE